MKHEADEEAEAFLAQPDPNDISHASVESRKKGWTQYLLNWRLLFEIALVSAVVYLIILLRTTPTKHLRRTPVPKLLRKMYTFHNDPQYTREDMFLNESTTLHTLHNWIPLSSESRGYIRAPASGSYDLPEPLQIALDRHNDGPGYMVSVFHQLHCLSYLAEHFQQGYGGIELTEEVAHHSAHCFNYVRQGLMCNADVTLEGKTEAGPGEGSEHECVDYDALLKWANDNAAYKWRNALLPEDSVL
ncbi:hypothetical protein EK21DRAFT_92312 [Setomelanomma holmii]|uniref:Oxidase ustYa n=1 Tax=Setomelanomma holmii TaxID=210430 RepID=A0A9P4LIH5_9PLEO|nr:hypothetical protein EK21DRAFT_92312 [Setomelanomma holmii]